MFQPPILARNSQRNGIKLAQRVFSFLIQQPSYSIFDHRKFVVSPKIQHVFHLSVELVSKKAFPDVYIFIKKRRGYEKSIEYRETVTYLSVTKTCPSGGKKRREKEKKNLSRRDTSMHPFPSHKEDCQTWRGRVGTFLVVKDETGPHAFPTSGFRWWK